MYWVRVRVRVSITVRVRVMVLYGGVDITTSAGGAGEVTDYTPFSLQEYETE